MYRKDGSQTGHCDPYFLLTIKLTSEKDTEINIWPSSVPFKGNPMQVINSLRLTTIYYKHRLKYI
jgi:hypothetical protein